MCLVRIGRELVWIGLRSVQVLSTPGGRAGQRRTGVVSPVVSAEHRYLLSFGQLDGVRNARASGWAILSRGRRETKVALVEVTQPDSLIIVREFPRQIPAGVQFFIRMGLVDRPGGPDQFESAADRLALFRVDPFDENIDKG